MPVQDGPVRLGEALEMPEPPTQAQEREAKAADIAEGKVQVAEAIAFLEGQMAKLTEPGGMSARGLRSLYVHVIGQLRHHVEICDRF